MFIPKPILIIVLVISFHGSFAQFGFLKEKADGMLKNAADRKSQKMQLEQLQKDTASFNYAVSLSDNASFFASDEDDQNLLLSALKLTKAVDIEETRAGVVFDYNRTGSTLYELGRFRMAEVKFMAALALFIDDNFQQYEERSRLEAQLVDAYLASLMVNLDLEDELVTESFSELDMMAYTQTLANLGLLNHTQGRLTRAERFSLQALDIRKNRLGESHPATAASLNNLAVLYRDKGKYNEAEKMFAQAIEIQAAVYGKNSMEYVVFLNNKALLYQATGRLEEAADMLTTCIATAKEHVNQKSRDYAKFMINLALLKHELGQYKEAEDLYDAVIAQKKKRFGNKHPEYAHVLNSLASLYMDMDKVAEAKALLEEALGIYQAKFGKNHPAYALTLNNLGHWYRYSAQPNEALGAYQEVEGIQKKLLGTNHPDYLATKENLCLAYWETGQNDKAADGFQDVVRDYLELIGKYFPPMSEHEKTRFWDKIRPKLMVFNSFAVNNQEQYPELLGQMFNLQLATKGLLLNASTKVRNQILSGKDQGLKDKYEEWLDQREQLAVYYTYSQGRILEEKVNLDSLEQEANGLEKELSSQSQAFANAYQDKAPTFQEIQGKLGQQEAAVEIIRFNAFDKKFTDKVNYVALVIDNTSKLPSFALLTNGVELETKFYKYYKTAVTRQIEDDYTFQEYWEPIHKLLAGKKKVFLSSDGVYHQTNVNTLRLPDGSFVLDHLDINLVASTRDLAEPVGSKSAKNTSAILVGNPTYGSTGKIQSLPGTKIEVENLETIMASSGLSPSTFTQTSASESNLKQIETARILHIATHGYFLEDLSVNTTGKVFGIEVEKARENPLLRSGLMLSDAEKALGQMDHRELGQENNGILTAFEAMNLKLTDTDLVVLSACETGLGDIKAGEGVYGLQRAFQVAGAKSLIMSLWKVSDEATQKLMVSFYKNWLSSNDKQTAFHKAQLELKKSYPEPYFWGAFVLLN